MTENSNNKIDNEKDKKEHMAKMIRSFVEEHMEESQHQLFEAMAYISRQEGEIKSLKENLVLKCKLICNMADYCFKHNIGDDLIKENGNEIKSAQTVINTF